MMHTFQILELLTKEPDLSQKTIASRCDISSGKVNYTLNNLDLNGLIETIKLGKKHRYVVTEKGREYLKQRLEELHETKVLIHGEQEKQVKQAVILAAGLKEDFDVPPCLLKIDNLPLIERTISILERYGIEKIVIVAGFKKQAFYEVPSVKNSEHIILVENDRYEYTGSMASLALTKEYINDDFLLVEDDILIEDSAIKKILVHPERDTVLVTKESGSGDEAFIEIRNNYLYKISKDVHQLNRIDGEMIGITKLSYRVFDEMIDLYKDNQNPYMNYEYMLLDVSRKIDIGYLKISDLFWSEIDNKEHYQNVIDHVYPMLQRKEASYREEALKREISKALHKPIKQITHIEPFGGMTNRNYKVTIEDKEYVVRVSGRGTEGMINRYHEKRNSEIASSIGINPLQLYFNEKTGLKIAKYIPDAETLNSKTAKREHNLTRIADLLRRLHDSNVEMDNNFDVFLEMEKYEKLVKESKGEFYPHYQSVKRDILRMKQFYRSLKISLTPCHNDTIPENFVKSGEHILYLIDWEYAGMNDSLWDVAAFLLESGCSEKEEALFLQKYFNRTPTHLENQRILLNKIFQDFLWSIWTIQKESKGVSFGPYGINRFNRARKNIKRFHEKFGEYYK